MTLAAPVLALLLASNTLASVPDSDATPLSQEACSKLLTVVAAFSPQFPDLVLKARLFMVVPVDVTINSAGSVTGAVLQQGTRDLFSLGQLSMEAATQWRFNAAPDCEVREATLVFDYQRPVPIGTKGGTIFKPPFLVEIFRTDIRFDTRPIS